MVLDKSDEDLMVLYKNGNEEAFLALYNRHAKRIFGYIRSRVKSEEKANDIFQDVFIKIHRSKELYNKSFPVLPWLFTITRTTLIDSFRKQEKHETSSVDFENITTEGFSESNLDVSEFLSKLPQVQRSALEMRFLEEKSFDEIAILMKTSSSNVRQIVSRGIKKIKQLIGDES